MARRALIIGGNGGVGANIVKAFAAAGYDTAYSFRSKDNEELKALPNVRSYKADAVDEDQIAALAASVRADLGGLDVCVYASGIFENGVIMKTEAESWKRVLDVNLTGAFYAAKHMTPMLRESGSGRFVAISSVTGDLGVYGACSYAASKAGLVGLVRTVALENLKYGVTANIISLGYMETGMGKQLSDVVYESVKNSIPMKRFGNPADLAQVVVDVCSEHANYICGQTIRVNGMLYA